MSFNTKIVLLIIILAATKMLETLNVCPKIIFKDLEVTFNQKISTNDRKPFNCSWTIDLKEKEPVIITVKILQLEFPQCKNQKCCSKNYLYLNGLSGPAHICQSQKIQWISLRQRYLEIQLVVNSGNAKLCFEYSTRKKTECSDYDFQCLDKTGCFNGSQICDKIYSCSDHSDEIGCANCSKKQVPCSNNSPSVCFNPTSERCNGIIDCPYGEDEMGCTTICSKIKCTNESLCIDKFQICDGIQDCSSNLDESNCNRKSPNNFFCDNGKCTNNLIKNNVENWRHSVEDTTLDSITVSIIFVVSIFLTLLFITLVCRWCSHRRDINRLLQNLPDFPLPPFRGPGEFSRLNLSTSESDYMIRGEIYDGFFETMRDMERRKNSTKSEISRKNSSTRTASSTPSHTTTNDLDEGTEVVTALFSLGVSRTMCVGLDDYFERQLNLCVKLSDFENQEDVDRFNTFLDACGENRRTENDASGDATVITIE